MFKHFTCARGHEWEITPFRGATLLETLDQVHTREPVPPARLNPADQPPERWCRRNPAAAALSAALAACVGGGFVAVTALWPTAEKHRRHAEQNLEDARRAVHQHFVLVCEADLDREPGAHELRKKPLGRGPGGPLGASASTGNRVTSPGSVRRWVRRAHRPSSDWGRTVRGPHTRHPF